MDTPEGLIGILCPSLIIPVKNSIFFLYGWGWEGTGGSFVYGFFFFVPQAGPSLW